MNTETQKSGSARRWLWFVAIWAAGVVVFGGVVYLLRRVMGALLA